MSISIVALALAYVFLLFLVLLAIFRSEIGSGLKLMLAALCLGGGNAVAMIVER